MASGLHAVDHDFVDFRLLYHKILAVSECLPDVSQTIKEQELTPEWVARTGMQQPTYISYSGEPLESSSLDLEGLSKALGLLDKEVVTLDVSKQAPGPKWTLRQWCLYWRDRKVFSPDLLAALAHPLQPLQPPPPQHTGSEVAARLSASSSRGEEAGDMDDEADSAFVHQGDVDQFVDKEAPRKGIREASKRRLMALACLPIADALKAQRRSGRSGALGAAAGSRPGGAGLPSSSAAGAGAAAGPSPGMSHGGELGPASAAPGASASDPGGGTGPLSGLPLLQELEAELSLPPAILGADLLSALVLPSIAQQLQQRHYLALHPAGSVTNFQVNAGGATCWLRVLRGALVAVLLPPTEQNLQAYCSWVSYQARDKGLLLLDACSGALRAEVHPGSALLVPGGWPYALVAKSDCLMVGAQLLHCHNLRLQLAAWEMEELLHVKARLRFPSFKHIMWHAAVHYSKLIRAAVGLPKSLRTRDQASAAHAPAHPSRAEGRGAGSAMLPPSLRPHPPLSGSGGRLLRPPRPEGEGPPAPGEDLEDLLPVPLLQQAPPDRGSAPVWQQRQGGLSRALGGAAARGPPAVEDEGSEEGSEVGSWAMDGARDDKGEEEGEEEEEEEGEEEAEEEEDEAVGARRTSHLRASSRLGDGAAARVRGGSGAALRSVRDWDDDDAEEGGSWGGRQPPGHRGLRWRPQASAEEEEEEEKGGGGEEEDDDPLGLRAAEEQSSESEPRVRRRRSRRPASRQRQPSRKRRRVSRSEMDDFIVEDEEEGGGEDAAPAESEEGSQAAPQRRSRRKPSRAAGRPLQASSRPRRTSASRAIGRDLEATDDDEELGDEEGTSESGGSTAAGGRALRTHNARQRPTAPGAPPAASPLKATLKIVVRSRPPAPVPAAEPAAAREQKTHVTLRLAPKEARPGT